MRRFLLLSLTFAAWACAQPRPLPEGVRAERDVAFAKTPEKELLLDLYLPEEPPDEKLPAVVWVHGGAWRAGSKDNTPAMPLAARDFVVASVGYRLSQEALFPAQIHDVKAAVRWLRANAKRYGVDPDRIGAWGSSAGGHLVGLLGVSGGVEDLEGDIGDHPDQSSRVQAVVDFFGPSDFLQMDAHSISDRNPHDSSHSPESQLVGGPIQQHPDRVRRVNPITYVTPDDPPFLIVHGDQDPLVPHHQSVLLDEALRRAGVPVELVTIEGGGHGRGGLFGSEELFERVLGFFEHSLADRP